MTDIQKVKKFLEIRALDPHKKNQLANLKISGKLLPLDEVVAVLEMYEKGEFPAFLERITGLSDATFAAVFKEGNTNG
jgi:hypothetical protein